MENKNSFEGMPLGYFNALMNTVLGSDQQRDEAKKFLKEIDPDIWDEQLKFQLSPAMLAAYPQAYGLIVDNPGFCDHSHKSCDTP